MKRLTLVFILILLAYFSFGQTSSTSSTENLYQNGILYVKVKDNHYTDLTYQSSGNSPLETVLPFLLDFNVKSIENAVRTRSVKLSRIYEVKFDTIQNPDSLVYKFEQESFIEYAEKVPIYKPDVLNPNDPIYTGTIFADYQWNMEAIDAAGAWDISTGDTDVVLSITDDAVDIDHPDLQSNIWVNQDEVQALLTSTDPVVDADGDGEITSSELALAYGSLVAVLDIANGVCDGVDNGPNGGNGFVDDIFGWDFAEDDNNPCPPAGTSAFFSHGTHVAGIAAAHTNNSIGIAALSNNHVKIMCLKHGADVDAGFTNMLQGLDYSRQNGAQIMNMSWGGYVPVNSQEIALIEARDYGILCIAAAGNDGGTPEAEADHYPAAYASTMSVGASDYDIMDELSDFSSYHPTVDVLAPGTDIQSTMWGTLEYDFLSGTSMSTPLVSSVAILMKSVCPNCNPEQIESCIVSTADNVMGIGNNSSYAGKIGSGRINAESAMACIIDSDPIAEFHFQYNNVCPLIDIQLYNTSAGYGSLTYVWSLPTGANFVQGTGATDANPIINFDEGNEEDYQVSLTVTNEQGANSTFISNINVFLSNSIECSDCNEVKNGSFSIFNIEDPDFYTLSHIFTQNRVDNWWDFVPNGHLRNMDTDPVAGLNFNSANWNGSLHNESIMTEVSLEDDKFYVLSVDYNLIDWDGGSDAGVSANAYFKLANDTIDTYQTDIYSNMPTIPDELTDDILTLDSIINYTPLTKTIIFKPSEERSRLFCYASSVEDNTGAILMLDNISIVSIEYPEYNLCGTHQLSPQCIDLINLPLDEYELTWYVMEGTASVIEDGNEGTFTPTVYIPDTSFLRLMIYCYATEEYSWVDVPVNYSSVGVLNATADITEESCVPGADGAIDITIYGDSSNYTVNWTGPSPFQPVEFSDVDMTEGDISGLGFGEYLCSIENEDGCVYSFSPLVPKAEINIEVNSTPTLEDNDCGNVYAVVGNEMYNYTYNWENSAGEPIGDTWMVGQLSSGIYFYTITDIATGCEQENSVTVGVGPGGALQDENIYLCDIDNEILNQNLPNVGYNEFIWSTGETTETIRVSSYGEYTVNMYNDAGCFAKRTFIVQPVIANISVRDYDKICEPNLDFNHAQYVFCPQMPNVTYQWVIKVYDDHDHLLNTSNLTGSDDFLLAPGGDWMYANIDLTITTSTGCVITNSETIYKYVVQINNYTEITTDKTWDFPTYLIENDVVVKDGATLNIVNSHVEFRAGYGFIVQDASSSIVIDNSTISNLFCEDLLWNGILVSGKSVNPHTLRDQPSVILKNSTIENAKTALKSSYGGVIKAEGSLIQNNEYGVWFDNYYEENRNVSEISNCGFEINAKQNIFRDLRFKKFIYLNQFESMVIDRSSFQNLDYARRIADRGIGTHAYQVKKLTFTRNQTNRLTHGLKVEAAKFSDVNSNTFNNTWRSSSFTDVDILDAQFNSFDDDLLRPTDHAYQMSITGCYLPVIAYNDFKNGVTGLYLNGDNIETGTGSDEEIFQIYKNSFTGFKMHSNTLSPDLNGYPSSIVNNGLNGTFGLYAEGAEIKCNSFNNYDYAIAVMSGAVKGEQGQSGNDPKDPAGNRFYEMGTEHNKADGRFFIKDGANQSQYQYWRHTNEECKPELFYTGPTNIHVNNSLFTFDPNNTSGSCPDLSLVHPSMRASVARSTATNGSEDEISSTERFEQKSMAITALDTEVSTQEEDLLIKVDKGNTELLLSDIQLATDQTYTDLVQEIQTIDSYLSDEAAIEFMDKTTERPLAKTIALLANSPLPTKAKAKVADLELSDELKAYIDAQQTGLSKRELDEKQIHQLKAQKNRWLKEAVVMAYRDSTDSLKTPVIDLLLDQEHWTPKELAYHLLQKTGQSSEAATLLTEMQSDLLALSQDQQYHMEDYLALMALELNIDTLCDSLRLVEIINQQVLLENIQSSEFTKGKAAAKLLMIEAGLMQEETFIQLPNPNDENRSENTEEVKPVPYVNLAKLKDLIQVYPNPVDDQLTVEYIMFNGLSANAISIYDMNARLLMTQKISKTMDILELNVSQLPPGSYVIALTKEGAKVNTTQFIVK